MTKRRMSPARTGAVLASLTVAITLTTATGADWPQLQHDPQRTGYTADQPKPPFENVWNFDVWPEDRILITVQPIVYDRKAIVGSKKGVLYAADKDTGKEAWRYATGGAINQSAAAAEGVVAVGSMDGCVHGVDATTGKRRWKTDLESRGITTAPLLMGRTIYIGTRGGRFAAIDITTGEVLWRRDIDSPICSSSASDGKRIFFVAEDSALRCLDAKRGKVLWMTPKLNNGAVGATTFKGYHPVVYKHLVYLTGYSYVVGRTDGSKTMGPMPAILTKKRESYWFKLDRAKTVLVKRDEMPRAYVERHEALREYRREQGIYEHLLIFDAETGKPGPTFCNRGRMSMAVLPQPPVVTPEGLLVFPTLHEDWSPCIGFFEAATGRIHSVVVPRMKINADEHHNFSIGGRVLLSFHFCEGRGTPAGTEAYDLDARKRLGIGLRKMHVAGHGEGGVGGVKSAPPGSSASISGNMFFHTFGSSVGAWRGK